MGSFVSRCTARCVALALAAAPAVVPASSFQLLEQNASGLGNAYAGSAAAAEDASTIFFNPAGMTRLPRRQLVLGLSLVRPSPGFKDQGSTPATLQGPGTGTGGDAGSIGYVPSAYVSAELLPGRVWAGLGVNVPFGLVTDWDRGWTGRFHALESDVKTVNLNPSVAAKVHDWISVGAGVSAMWMQATLTNSVNYSAIAFGVGGAPALAALAATCPGAGPTGAGCEGVGKVKGDDWGFGWNVGLLAELPTKTRIGLSYRSTVKQELEGKATFENRPALLAAGLPEGDIRATITLPDTFSISAAQEVLPGLEVLADWTWTGWSALQDLSIFRSSGAGLTSTPLEFEDSWRAGLGATYHVTEPLKVRLGVAYDKTPVKDSDRTPRLPDTDRTWLAAGAQWAFSQAGAVDVGVAWLLLGDATSRLPNVDPDPPAGFNAIPRGALTGKYDGNVWIAGLQARYGF